MNGAKILLVEDERVWREKLHKILEHEGYKVETAVGYGEALGRLRQGSFNLVVTDLRLEPEESPRDFAGMTLLADARKRQIPTIVVTGYPKVELARKAFEDYDVVQFLSKRTFEAERFRESARQALMPPAMKIEYRDFDLWIEAPTAEGYPLRASSETQGQAKGWLKLDPMSEPVHAYLEKLAAWATNEAFLIEFGTFLYNSLFTDDVESLFQLSQGEVIGQEEQGLRVRLRIDPPEISMLPWEYLYSPKKKYFLGASKKTPLTRYLEVFQPIRALRTILPLKVLVVIPSGSGLDTEKERDILTEALDKLGDAVQLKYLEGNVTRITVADALLGERYHVFHFIGHGVFKDDRGYLIFNDKNGGHDWISDDILARFFLDEPWMKLVVLNACEGAKASSAKPMVGMAPKLVERGIPAVIAHQYSIMDKAAICFAREFYRSLSEVGHVDMAMAHARNQLSIRFPAERSLGAPVLFMRAPNGLIFELKPSIPTPLPPKPPELSSEERRHLENLMATHERNRRVLEEQIAKLGTFAPPHMRTQLEDERVAIEEIKQKLEESA
jgi:CheY-like chemotaxis protein